MRNRLPQAPRTFARARRARRTALGALAVAGLIGGVLGTPAFAAGQAAGPELIVNGDFTGKVTAPWWWTEDNPASVVDGELCADIPGGTENPWDAIIGQNDLPLEEGTTYSLTYTASATVPAMIRVNVQEAEEPWATELSTDDRIRVAARTLTHEFTAQADNETAQIAFQVGGNEDEFTLCFDDISLTSVD